MFALHFLDVWLLAVASVIVVATIAWLWWER